MDIITFSVVTLNVRGEACGRLYTQGVQVEKTVAKFRNLLFRMVT